MAFQLGSLCYYRCPKRTLIRNAKNFLLKSIRQQTNGACSLRHERIKPRIFPFSKEETEEFASFFPLIVRDITEDENLDIDESTSRFAECLKYNVKNGNKFRGLTSVFVYKLVEEHLTEENVKLANILGWTIELMEAAVDVCCDMINNNIASQNRLAWFKNEGVGLTAIADIVALNSSVYVVLRKHFSSHPSYVSLLNQFHSFMMNRVLGQVLNSIKYNPREISMKKIEILAKYQTGYTFCSPFVLAVHLSKNYTEEFEDKIVPILLRMEKFHRAENEFRNWFNDTDEKHGKSDIEDGKCTWLAVKALEKCDLRRREIIYEHYGKSKDECVEAIGNLYKELDMQDEFASYEEEHFKFLSSSIRVFQNPHKKWLQGFMRKMYNRDVS